MALTGICLVLFVTFHVLMNAVAIVWPTAYNQVCLFLGANWYALISLDGSRIAFRDPHHLRAVSHHSEPQGSR